MWRFILVGAVASDFFCQGSGIMQAAASFSVLPHLAVQVFCRMHRQSQLAGVSGIPAACCQAHCIALLDTQRCLRNICNVYCAQQRWTSCIMVHTARSWSSMTAQQRNCRVRFLRVSLFNIAGVRLSCATTTVQVSFLAVACLLHSDTWFLSCFCLLRLCSLWLMCNTDVPPASTFTAAALHLYVKRIHMTAGWRVQCFAHADAFPHECGIGVCAKDANACGKFVANAVFSAVTLAISAVSAVATGGATAIAGALSAAGDTMQFFGSTKACVDSRIHPRSRMAIVTVRDREFKGDHIEQFDWIDWDNCLLRCRNNPGCKGVVSGPRSCQPQPLPHSSQSLCVHCVPRLFDTSTRHCITPPLVSREQAAWQRIDNAHKALHHTPDP